VHQASTAVQTAPAACQQLIALLLVMVSLIREAILCSSPLNKQPNITKHESWTGWHDKQLGPLLPDAVLVAPFLLSRWSH